jgi:hypothetical protein
MQLEVKNKDHIWSEDDLIYFRNTFSSVEGKHTLANMLYELGFWDKEVGRTDDGRVTIESAIEGAARRNYATTLLQRLALHDNDEMDNMIAGLLKGVKPIKAQKEKKK